MEYDQIEKQLKQFIVRKIYNKGNDEIKKALIENAEDIYIQFKKYPYFSDEQGKLHPFIFD